MGSASTTDPDQGHPRRWAALAALCTSLVVVTIDNTVLNTALPALATGLPASTADLQWINNAYTLVFAAMLITAGSLGARMGQRLALTGGLTVFALGSAVAATAGSAGQLIGLRAVMGLGAAFVMPATLSTIVTLFGPRERPKAIALWSATAGLGIVIGPIAGGLLLEHFSWSSVFWINVPLVAIALGAVLLLLPPMPGRPGGRLDIPGLLLSASGLAALVDVIVQGPERGWLSATSLAEAAAAVLLLAAFAGWELRTAEPMVDIRVFAIRAFSLAGVLLAVTFFALFGLLFVFTQYLQLVHGYSPLKAGLGAVPFALAMAATAATSARTAARLGTRHTIAGGLALMSLGLAGVSLVSTGTPYLVIAAAMAVVGAGMGLIMAPASAATVNSLPREKAPTAGSINSVVRELGGVLGIAVVGTVVSASYRDHLESALPGAPAPAAEDLTSAHIVAAHLPAEAAGRLLSAADQAFTTAMHGGTWICAAITLVGAVTALLGFARTAPAAHSADDQPDLGQPDLGQPAVAGADRTPAGARG
ncbi:MFS transporter [Kitasatospora herbaricolor]|uniref:MFS transporter n=1 Tax=Kitasatospora herbaricolor TaxID=68217 RepID=UPI00174EC570|nr:MFS transporter [Kitasatospora herbaricolor]MDQ0306976.1 EmrB/QacA subfamily drug resistance transporter [Kitasatospora herbaricolor]GGV18967.1 MFS transporter [Kitasatospora herbaricolor]